MTTANSVAVFGRRHTSSLFHDQRVSRWKPFRRIDYRENGFTEIHPEYGSAIRWIDLNGIWEYHIERTRL